MADLVLFAGPAIVDSRFNAIPWRRQTVIKMVNGAGSDYFKTLASQLRGSDGRILPTLVKTYSGAPMESWDKIALASFSAGWGLLNEVAKIPADVDRLTGFTMHDSAFGGGLEGFRALADRAATRADKVVVFTNTNNSANAAMGILRTARQTVLEIMDNVRKDTGVDIATIPVLSPMPKPSGGVWGAGSLAWYDYVKPGAADNTGNDLSHEEHNYLAAKVWEAYLVPAFAGTIPSQGWKTADKVGFALAMGALVVAAWQLRK